MKKILIIQPIHKSGIELLKNNNNYEFEIIEDTEILNLKSKIVDCDAVSIRTANLPAEAINAAENLKIISRHGVGYDNIDLKSKFEKIKKLRSSNLPTIPSDLEDELKSNIFLRCDQNDLKNKLNMKNHEDFKVFKKIRDLKDIF